MGRKNSNARPPRTPRNLHAVPYTETPAEQALIKAVTAHPNTTATELAELAEVGNSTARKILAEFAEKGTIIRTSAPGAGPGRTPDRWTLADTETPGPTQPTDLGEEPPSGGGDEPTFGQGRSGESLADEVGESEQDGFGSEPGSHPTTGTTAGEEQVSPGPVETVSQKNATSGVKSRAGKNELRGKVGDYLLEHPDEEFGPHALGVTLGHSSGAIANVLEKLAGEGYARRVGDSPKRYTATPDEEPAS